MAYEPPSSHVSIIEARWCYLLLEQWLISPVAWPQAVCRERHQPLRIDIPTERQLSSIYHHPPALHLLLHHQLPYCLHRIIAATTYIVLRKARTTLLYSPVAHRALVRGCVMNNPSLFNTIID